MFVHIKLICYTSVYHLLFALAYKWGYL